MILPEHCRPMLGQPSRGPHGAFQQLILHIACKLGRARAETEAGELLSM